jgi:tol-pal system protein YbgF
MTNTSGSRTSPDLSKRAAAALGYARGKEAPVMSSRAGDFALALAWISAFSMCVPVSAAAADRDIVELQRDVALVGDQVKTLQTTINNLQSTVNDKLGAHGALIQQTLDGVNQIHTENAVRANTITDQLQQQQQKLTAPVASLNAKLDQLISQVSASQDNLSDLSSRLGRLEQRLVDLDNAVKVLQAPPAPPPPNPQAPGGPPAGMTAQGLFQNATRDQLSGNSDLALQEYQVYLKYFGDTETAGSAQFHIGEILFNQGNLDDAIMAFDNVVEQYPKTSKAPDALYMKAQALRKEGKRTAAIQVLNQLVRQYPDSDVANNAKAELPRPNRPARK